MNGRGAIALAFDVRVAFRRLRPHERRAVEPGRRVVVAIAHTPHGPEEQPWLVPARDAKRAFNPRRRDLSRALEAGQTPPGWLRL